MIIKKFQGKTEEEALQAAKKELGELVVVMNVRQVKRKGFFSILKPQMIEVTVALEEEPQDQSAQLRSAVAAVSEIAQNHLIKTEQQTRGAAGQMHHAEQQTRDVAGQMHKTVTQTPAAGDAGSKTAQKNFAGNDAMPAGDDANSGIEEKLETLQNMLKRQMDVHAEEDGEENAEQENPNVAFFKLLYNVMLENEVNEKYANQLIDDLDKTMKPDMPIDFMLSNVYQKMVLKFGQPSPICPAQKGPKVVFFIGPTGVGKTTTIAKIASKFCVEQKKKIALLTADTYRIAAAEQLRTYASILEVPFRIVYTPPEIKTAVQDFYSYDYILVDTAGHSHHNEELRRNMSILVDCVEPEVEKEVYLVVSATTKYRDLTSIADSYRGIVNYKLIFTKLDETMTLGNLLNLKLYTGAAMSYVTCGQNVPDDIADFNAQETVKLLLGGGRIG